RAYLFQSYARCRDLHSFPTRRSSDLFEVDVNTSLSLIRQIPKDKPAVAESGIQDVETILTLREAGFKGFLVGERFMKEEDPAQRSEEHTSELQSRENLVCRLLLEKKK